MTSNTTNVYPKTLEKHYFLLRSSFGRAAGACCPLAVGAWGVGVGSLHQPHCGHSCELALRAVGAAGGPLGGGGLLHGSEASGMGRSPTPDRPSLGRAAGACYPLVVGAGGVGVGTRHQSHSVRSCELALRAVEAARGRPGGGTSCLGVGRPGLGALPRPTACTWGVRFGPVTRWLWVLRVWAWGTVTYPTARALASRLCALWGRYEGARWGGASCLGVARPGLGALRRPTPRPWGARLGPSTHWLWMRCAGVGARLALAPSPVPSGAVQFVACCPRLPGFRHPVAVVAWHLSLCRG